MHIPGQSFSSAYATMRVRHAQPTELLRIGNGMAGTWVTWDSQNDTTPIRRQEECHLERRAMGCAANMYVALAAYVRPGLLGIYKKLRWHDYEKLLKRVDVKTCG